MHTYTAYREIYGTMWHEMHEATCLPRAPKVLHRPCKCFVPANYSLDFRL